MTARCSVSPRGRLGHGRCRTRLATRSPVLRKTSFWRDTFEIERLGEVFATVRRVRGRGKPRYEILLATGARLTATRSPTGKKFDVRSAEGQPFCQLGRPWFSNTRNVEVEEGAELVLAFSVIACFIQLQEIDDTAA